jgi:tetratricopeptide (TPR) repeat protein
LILDLSDPDFWVRERATRELWTRGEVIRPALKKVVQEGTVEAADRADGVLAKFDWGITPDTPKQVLEQIGKFRDGTNSERELALIKLIDFGAPGRQALRLLLIKDVPDPPQAPPGSARAHLFDRFGGEVRTRVPFLLFAGRNADAEGLLELAVLGSSDQFTRDYVSFMAARGKSAAAVDQLARQHVASPDNVATAVALAYAHRAAGDGEKAKAVLKKLVLANPKFDDLYDNLLVDLGDWAELVDRPARNPNSAEGLKAFRLRLAGKPADADALLKRMIEADAADSRGFGMEAAAIGLFVNGRTQDGLDRLRATESAPHTAADIHTARLEFAEADGLIKAGLADDRGTVNDGGEATTRRTLTTLYKLKRAKLLAQLGERDAAAQVFQSLEDVADRSARGVQAEMVRTAFRSGFPGIAAGFLGKLQAMEDHNGDRGGASATVYDPFEALFDTDADAARYWWKVVRFADPKGNPSDAMRTVQELLAGKLKAGEVARWFQVADEYSARSEQADHMVPASSEGVRQALALAMAYRAYGDTSRAVAVLERFADRGEHKPTASARGWLFGLDETFRLWIDLGDWLGELGRHADAAKRLEQGWRLHPNHGVLLYLSGKALVDAGDVNEGKRRMELAHVVPLGSPQLRGRFLEELVNRGAKAELRTEIDRVGECAWGLDSNISGNVWNQVGRASALLHDFPTAAAAQRKSMHFVLKTANIVYVEGFAYANVPATVKGLDARGLAVEGRVREAVAAANEVLAMVPTHVETLHAITTLLDSRGQSAAADKLFTSAWDRCVTALRGHPNSAWLKHQAAWLAVGCRREKEAALKFAKEAVADEPDNKAYREALAEAHFRNGDRAKAIGVMTKLTSEVGRNWHFKRQLERYKSAAFDAPLPFLAE